MNKDINQLISQFLDDELDHSELDSLLLEIKKQPELKKKISRYQVQFQVLKTDHAVNVNTDFLDKINQQIKQEPHYLLPQKLDSKKSLNFWQKTSLAVAASVMCVAVIMSQQNAIQINHQPQQIAAVDTQIDTQTVEQLAQKDETVRKPSQHERLKAYLQAHNDDLYTHGSLNIHPMVQTASYGRTK